MSLEKLQPIVDEVYQLIILDDTVEKESLLKLVIEALGKEQYINSIKSTLDEIFADKKIDANDIPNMMLLSIQVNNILPDLLGLTKSITALQVKYIVYGSVYNYIKENKNDFFDGLSVDAFRIAFSSMWKLIEINPKNLILESKKRCGCCNDTPVKSSEPIV